MVQRRPHPAFSANFLCDGDLARAQAVLEHPARHTEVEPYTVGAAAGRPRTPRIDQRAVARLEKQVCPILQVTPDTRELRDQDTRAVFSGGVEGPLPKRNGTGRESCQR